MEPTTKKIQQEVRDLKAEVEALKALVHSLSSSTTIPLEVAAAIRARLSEEFTVGDSSSTLPSTHTQGVDEAGLGSYSVAKVMTGFIEITFNGVSYNVPYY